MLLDDFRHPKITQLNPSLIIQEHIVQLDVSMEHWSAVAVTEPVDNLLKDVLGLILTQSFLTFDVMKKIPGTCVLHDDEEVLWAFEDFEKSNYVGVMDFLEDVNFLEYFLTAEIVFHVGFFEGFDCDLFTAEFMNAKGYFAKCSFTD